MAIPCRILALHAHPDDAEILAGGTLALLAEAGHRLTIATMTPGDKGSSEIDAEEIARIRRAEAESAAKLIGAEYLCAEFRDLAIFDDDASRRRVVEVIRRARPDIVLTSSPQDYLSDHEVTSTLVRDGCFAAMARNYLTNGANAAPVLPAIPHLYFMDPIGGMDREGRRVAAHFYFDVASSFATKKAMLAEHRSQRDWLRSRHGIDEYLDTMENWTRASGARAGVELAEGFRQYRGHPYPQSPLLQKLLAGHGLTGIELFPGVD
jgi:LmbE family N-acetylglucosaminyl deacetylase